MLTSPTLWAAIVTVLASLAQLFGLVISAEDQATLTQVLPAIATGAAGVVVIVRRYLPRSS